MRVSSAGPESSVDVPKKINSYTVHIPVSRTNRDDFVYQLLPLGSEQKRAATKVQTDERIKKAFGAHFEYELLNAAFSAMVPEQESWTVEVTLNAILLSFLET